MVVIEKDEIKSFKPFPKQKAKMTCVFEYIYFEGFSSG